jgi:hypothetical protein
MSTLVDQLVGIEVVVNDHPAGFALVDHVAAHGQLLAPAGIHG